MKRNFFITDYYGLFIWLIGHRLLKIQRSLYRGYLVLVLVLEGEPEPHAHCWSCALPVCSAPHPPAQENILKLTLKGLIVNQCEPIIKCSANVVYLYI